MASLSPVEQLSSYMWIFWVVVVVVILVVIAGVFFVWHLRMQLFSLSTQVAQHCMFGGHELASFNRVNRQDEDGYEFPHHCAFRNEYREG